MTEQVKDDEGCYDIRGLDNAQKYAQFATSTASEHLQSFLQCARAMLPENHIGDKLWLTRVSQASVYERIIADWAREFANAVCTMKPLRKTRRYPLVPSYKREWGDWAALDACAIVAGRGACPSVSVRCEQLGCQWDTYRKVRNFVASALTQQIIEFEVAFEISKEIHKRRRKRSD